MKNIRSLFTKFIWLALAIPYSTHADTRMEICRSEMGFTASMIELFDNASYRTTLQECLNGMRESWGKTIYLPIDAKYINIEISNDSVFREIFSRASKVNQRSGSEFTNRLSVLGPMDETPRKVQLDTLPGYQSSDR